MSVLGLNISKTTGDGVVYYWEPIGKWTGGIDDDVTDDTSRDPMTS